MKNLKNEMISTKLDIGCGSSKKEGFTGVDILKFPGVDIVHDLNHFPYPFKDNEIDEVWMDQVLEHLDEPMKVVEELFRICKNESTITISVPYFRSYCATIDPTHKNFFGIFWFSYFDPNHVHCKRYQYSKARFLQKNIEFDRGIQKKGFIYKLLVRFAHKFPVFYEVRLSHLFPLDGITFNLKVLK